MLAVVLAAVVAGAAEGPDGWCSVPPDRAGGVAVARRLEPWTDPAGPPPGGVHTEHTLAADPSRQASLAAERDLRRVRDAALAWRNGAGDVWLQRAAAGLKPWFETYRPDLNPIDETPLDALVEAYALVGRGLPADVRQADAAFLERWARAYVRAVDAAKDDPRAKGVWTNNWQSHRVKLVAMIAAATGSTALQGDAERLFRLQVAQNIRPDGEVLDFRQRDALHYVVYDLEPLLQASLAARSFGRDWYAMPVNGASLAKAVAWLEPYADGRLAHEEFVHSTVAFDAERARAGERGYSGPFQPRTAARLFHLAAAFDPRFAGLADRLGPKPDELTLCGQ
jgi:hypothetical protein